MLSFKNLIQNNRVVTTQIKKYATRNPGPRGPFASKRIQNLQDSIWSEFTPLAIKHNAVNLGQGFPDWETPEFVRETLNHVKSHQYSRAAGFPPLVNTLANYYSKLFQREINGMNEILITNGASGAFQVAIQSLVNPGDEVILFEPFYDIYPVQVEMAGGKPIFVPLREPETKSSNASEWFIDENELRRAITKNTRLIVLNNPHNPTGKVFTRKELEMIANIAKEFNLIVISDEVYEFVVFPGSKHERIATLPGMWDRTLTLCSAGKTFSTTGWKIGWIIGPQDLIWNAYLASQYNVFCVATPLQEAVAATIQQASQNGYFESLGETFAKKCEQLCTILSNVGLKPIKPQAGYFVLADISNIAFPYDEKKGTRDYEFCRWLPQAIGVASIPPSAFYSEKNEHLVENYARFCFCKKDETLFKAEKQLKLLLNYKRE